MSPGPGSPEAGTSGVDGFRHVGLLHDGPDDLVDRALVEVRRAIEAGDDVHLRVDRRTVRAFRAALGADAASVVFPPPSSVPPPSAPDFPAAMRTAVRTDRRTTVLGQYPAAMSAVDGGFGEDALNVVLGGLPLTLICCCRRDLDADLLAVARRTHPQLATTTGHADNPDFRAPVTASPTPAALWGTVAARVDVDGTGDLAELRRRVADVAGRAGLEGDAVRAAVLAVHEAAVLACRHSDPGRAGLTLELRAWPGGCLFTEVVGPRRVAGADGDPLSHVRPFCSHAAVHDEVDRRAVRVLSTV